MAEPLRWRHTSGAQIWHRRTICEPNGSSMTPRWRQPDSKSRSRSQRTAGRTCAAVCEESPNIYPTFTYADDPARFVEGEATQQVFRDERRRLSRKIVATSRNGSRCAVVLGAAVFGARHAVMTRWRRGAAGSRRNAWEPDPFWASLQHGAGVSISTVTRIDATVAGHRQRKPFQPGSSDRALL